MAVPLSRRRFLAAAGTLALAGAAASACASPIAAGLSGNSHNPNGLTYWNLFSGGDSANMVLMENAYQTSTLTVILTVVAASMSGFALSRTRFRGRAAIGALVLAGLMIPQQVLILPQFEEFRVTGLLNTYWVIIFPAVAAPVAVFVFMAFFGNIPDPLIEVARIDGASWWRV